MAFEELLEWSGGRSEWQQDALRRLAVESQLTPDDLGELRSQIEHACGLPVETEVESVPLDASHLNEGQDELPPIETVEADLNSLKGFCDDARERQKGLQKDPKHEAGLVPEFA